MRAHAWLKFGSALIHPCMVISLLCVSLIASTSPFTSPSSSLWSPCSSFCPTTSSSRMSWQKSLCNSAEDLSTLTENEPPTGYEPNKNHITEAYVEYTQESTCEQRSRNDFDYDDVTIGKALSRRVPKTSRSLWRRRSVGPVCGRQSVMIERGDPLFPPHLTHKFRVSKKLRDTALKVNRLGLSWTNKESRFSLTVQAEIRKHEFQADYDRRSIQKLNEVFESQRGEVYRPHQGDERLRQYHQLLHEQVLKQTWDIRQAHEESLSEMEELKRFQGSTYSTQLRGGKLVEDRNTIFELTGKIQKLQNEINCMHDSMNFQDAESVRSGHSHVVSKSVSVPPHPVPGWLLSRSLRMPSRREGPPKHLGHTCYIGKRFLHI